MAGYDSIIARDASDDPLVPEQYRPELIAEITEQSAVLTSARKVPLTSKTSRQPVLSVLPNAYWVNGDTGLKETDAVDFKNAIMTAEELAVIVPIPEAYLDDAATPVWSVVRPLLAEAMGIAIDNAILWGVSKPATWTDPALIPGAVAAGNKVIIGGTGEDIGQDIANNLKMTGVELDLSLVYRGISDFMGGDTTGLLTKEQRDSAMMVFMKRIQDERTRKDSIAGAENLQKAKAKGKSK